MKRTIYIYCGEDGSSGKRLAASLRDGETRVFLHAAAAFTGIADPRCDLAIVMPDVKSWVSSRIYSSYGPDRSKRDGNRGLVQGVEPAAHEAVLYGESTPVYVGGSLSQHLSSMVSGLSAQHRGFGRWYVMRGEEIISGPHTKEQAQRFAA